MRGTGGGNPRRSFQGTLDTPPTTFGAVSRPRGATKRGPRGFFVLLVVMEPFRSFARASFAAVWATAALFAAKA
jgi:hypothetical protein